MISISVQLKEISQSVQESGYVVTVVSNSESMLDLSVTLNYVNPRMWIYHDRPVYAHCFCN